LGWVEVKRRDGGTNKQQKETTHHIFQSIRRFTSSSRTIYLPNLMTNNPFSLLTFTNRRQLLVDKEQLTELVRNWKRDGFREKTGGDSSGPAGRRNSQFFDGRAVDAEMRAWIDTGVPPSRGSMLRFIIWRMELSNSEPGGLVLSEVMSKKKVRKSSFTTVNSDTNNASDAGVESNIKSNRMNVRRGR